MVVKTLLVCALLILSLSMTSAAGLDVLSGTTTLGGNQNYDWVYVGPGATLAVNSTIGWLNITGINNITIIGTVDGGKRANTTAGGGGLNGAAGGATGQAGNDAAGGNGANAATGGGGGGGTSQNPNTNGASGTGAGLTGDQTSKNYTQGGGSGGGGGGGANGGTPGQDGAIGENGGAAIRLYSPIIKINGTITVLGGNGGNGGNSGGGGVARGGGGGGGGAAGTILVEGSSVNISKGIFNLAGGTGGSGGTSGGGTGTDGAGGRLKVFYTLTFENVSSTVTLTGGTTGTAFYNLTNSAPILVKNETIPNSLAYNTTGNYLNITIRDSDSDGIINLTFNVRLPNGTTIIDNQIGTRTAGNTSLGQNETWASPTFSIPAQQGAIGTWSWNFTAYTNGGPNLVQTGSFTITDSVKPLFNITRPTANSIYTRNVSIPLNFSFSDDIAVNWCAYSLNGGATNYTIGNCGSNTSLYFDYTAGTYNISFFVNDTSNNRNSTTILNVTIQRDTTNPLVTINTPASQITSVNFMLNITVIDTDGPQYCYYNITRGASLELANTRIDNCGNTSVSVSGDATYVLWIFVNDTSGNINITNKTFVVSNSGFTPGVSVGGGGGGGSIQQNITDIVNQLTRPGISKACDPRFAKFQDVYKVWAFNRTGENFKAMYQSLLDFVFCRSSASIVAFVSAPFILAGGRDAPIPALFVPQGRYSH